jgi:RNA polymerase sigma factor (sigma-70 family)
MNTDDMDLLRQYARLGSEEAFAALVSRHVNLVYSVALRQTGNGAMAEEITQAAFIVLARKANSLDDKTILPGWLCRTARNVAANALTIQRRRQRREQEACMENILTGDGGASLPTNEETWARIAPLLDAALGRLGGKDHDAIVLRFFENKELKQVGAALGVSEDAAKKRVTRALEKLRQFFFKRGVDSTAAAIGETMTANSIQAAPAALTKTVTAVALAKGAATGGSTAALAKTTLLAMKTKTTVTIAASVIVLGAGTYWFAQWFGHSAANKDVQPVKLANDSFVDINAYIETIAAYGQKQPPDWLQHVKYDDAHYVNEVDLDTHRTSTSPPAGHIKSLVTPGVSGSADYLASINSRTNAALQSARYIRYDLDRHSALLGKRIRVSGWVKTKDVANWAGASLAIVNAGGHIFACDPMTDRPISGTTDWRQIGIVTDAPNEPCTIYCGPMLYGTGELWCDDFQIEAVPSNTPITDDRIWHVWSSNPNDYPVTTDGTTLHDGHPTLCIAYTPAGAAPQGSWVWWGQDIRAPEKYLGHKVRMTVWMKSESVSGRVVPNLRPKGPNFKLLVQFSASGQATGTTGWTPYTTICFIPKGTQCLDTGFDFSGSGKVWIDMDSLKYENIDNPDKPRLIR